jgi:16S rRNA (guanine966-N2)-methyltransferase
MRVIAGELKGRRLVAPRGRRVRPTSDRVREAIFSALGTRVEGARVLDLYCGTGALAIEALSRGAAEAVLVDRDTRAALGNVERLGLGGDARLGPGGGAPLGLGGGAPLGLGGDARLGPGGDARLGPGGGAPLGLGGRARLVRADVSRWLAGSGGEPPFDLVFVDAPYRLADRVGQELDSHLPRLLAAGGTAVVECGARRPLRLASLEPLRQRRYGAAEVTFYGRGL